MIPDLDAIGNALEDATPICECSTAWEHGQFDCCKGKARLSPMDLELEVDGRIWMERHEALIGMVRKESFYLEDLKRNEATHALWNALHQSKTVLINYLDAWQLRLFLEWERFQIAPGLSNPFLIIDNQEATYVRLGLLNKIIRLLLQPENQLDLFGSTISNKEESALQCLLFDLDGVTKLPEGGFEGKLVRVLQPATSPPESHSRRENPSNEVLHCDPLIPDAATGQESVSNGFGGDDAKIPTPAHDPPLAEPPLDAPTPGNYMTEMRDAAEDASHCVNSPLDETAKGETADPLAVMSPPEAPTPTGFVSSESELDDGIEIEHISDVDTAPTNERPRMFPVASALEAAIPGDHLDNGSKKVEEEERENSAQISPNDIAPRNEQGPRASDSATAHTYSWIPSEQPNAKVGEKERNDSGVALKSESPNVGVGDRHAFDRQEKDHEKEKGEISESDTEDGGVMLTGSQEIDDSYFAAHLANLVPLEGGSRNGKRVCN